MGQSWQFVNVDKARKTCWSMPMGEIFFSEWASYIIGLIAVPANAPKDYRKPVTGKGSWAGDCILFVGDHTKEWPENILNSKPGDALNFKTLDPLHFVCRHALTMEPYETQLDDKSYPRDMTWVLRNLDRKVYIRSNGLPSAFEHDRILRYYKEPGPFAVPGLGSVLLGKVRWSSDPSCDMSAGNEFNLTRGEWAGDRIDARHFQDVENELKSGGWLDHTNIEAKKLRALWKSEKRGEDISAEDEKHKGYYLAEANETDDDDVDAEGETDPEYDYDQETELHGDTGGENDIEILGDEDAKGEDDPMYDEDAEREEDPMHNEQAVGKNYLMHDEDAEGEDDPMHDEDAEGDDDSMCDEDAEGEDDPECDEDAEGEIDEEFTP